MHDDDAPVSSPTQDSWCDLAEAVRRGLLAACARTDSMGPHELQRLVAACSAGMWLAIYCQAFDTEVELQRRRWAAGD